VCGRRERRCRGRECGEEAAYRRPHHPLSPPAAPPSRNERRLVHSRPPLSGHRLAEGAAAGRSSHAPVRKSVALELPACGGAAATVGQSCGSIHLSSSRGRPAGGCTLDGEGEADAALLLVWDKDGGRPRARPARRLFPALWRTSTRRGALKFTPGDRPRGAPPLSLWGHRRTGARCCELPHTRTPPHAAPGPKRRMADVAARRRAEEHLQLRHKPATQRRAASSTAARC
jgi:hypothetical protein